MSEAAAPPSALARVPHTSVAPVPPLLADLPPEPMPSRRGRASRWWGRLAWLVVLGAALAGGWAWWSRPPEVPVVAAWTGPAVEAIYATGSVEPVRWARVGPALRGRIVAVLAEEGERVAEGQPLARLDDREAAQRVAEAEARATLATEELTRARSLVAREVAARATLERAEAEARAARAVAEASRRRLDDYVVRAPLAGTVLRRDAEPGEVVDTPAALFWVGEPRPLRVSAEVDEEDIARVVPGQRALLRADAFPGRALEARVASVTPKGDSQRKSYRVRLALPDDTPLLVGMTVEANLVLAERAAAVLVPPRAVRDGRVFVVGEDGVARERRVEPGATGPRATEARSGIAAGERVVATPPPTLRDGDRVRAAASDVATGGGAGAAAPAGSASGGATR